MLILLAAIWTFGVRMRLDAGAHTILGAMFFLAAAIWLGVSGSNKLHSLWLVAVGFMVPIVVALISAHARFLFGPFRILAGIFAGIVRVGIPAERIKAAHEKAR